MKKYLILLLALTSFIEAFSQSHKLSGKVLDQTSEAIPFANVVLFNEDGSTQISGTTSDFEGNFEISAVEGNYLLKISFVSFKEKNIAVNLNKNKNLGNVELESSITELEEVTITETKSVMEMKLDKRVFNVGSDLTNAGGSAADGQRPAGRAHRPARGQ